MRPSKKSSLTRSATTMQSFSPRQRKELSSLRPTPWRTEYVAFVMVILLLPYWLYGNLLTGAGPQDIALSLAADRFNQWQADSLTLIQAWFKGLSLYPFQDALQFFLLQSGDVYLARLRIMQLLLHLLNALMVGRILMEMRCSFAWWVSLMFVLHPLQIEALGWVTKFTLNLSCTGLIVTFWLLLQWLKQPKLSVVSKWYFAALFTYALALLCDPNAAGFSLAWGCILGLSSFKHLQGRYQSWLGILLLGILHWCYALIQGDSSIFFPHISLRASLLQFPQWFLEIALSAFFPFTLKIFPLPFSTALNQPGMWISLLVFLFIMVVILLGKSTHRRNIWWLFAFHCALLYPQSDLLYRAEQGYYYGSKALFYACMPLLCVVIISFFALFYNFILNFAQKNNTKPLIQWSWNQELPRALQFILALLIFSQALSTYFLIQPWRDQEYFWHKISLESAGLPQGPFQLGQLALSNRAWSEAHRWFNVTLENSPNYYFALLGRGRALLELQNAEMALLDFTQFLSVLPNHPLTLAMRGRAYDLIGQENKADDDFALALLHNPLQSEVFLFRGFRFSKKTQWQEALQEYQAVLSLHPHHLEATLGLAKVGLSQKTYQQALQDLDPLFKVYSTSQLFEAFVLRGKILMGFNRNEEAVKDFSTALALRPRDRDIRLNRGIALAALGEIHKALDDFLAAAKENIHEPLAYYYLGRMHEEMQQQDKAMEYFTLSIQMDDTFAPAYIQRGMLYKTFKNDLPFACHDFKIACDQGDCQALQEAQQRDECS